MLPVHLLMAFCVNFPGAAGLIYGGAAGVIRSPNPVIHSLSCGIHWFACGSTFWCSSTFNHLSIRVTTDHFLPGLRSNIIKLHLKDQASPHERAYVSAVSGGISGGFVTRLMGILYLTNFPFELYH